EEQRVDVDLRDAGGLGVPRARDQHQVGPGRVAVAVGADLRAAAVRVGQAGELQVVLRRRQVVQRAWLGVDRRGYGVLLRRRQLRRAWSVDGDDPVLLSSPWPAAAAR